ncbi:MAG: restriction endonuclease [Candidatus Nealsonbacteria bacterium]|nr:restriction endonuclease [Candidatus Nealsonbacteria bacterium]
MQYPSIRIEGAILSGDIIDAIERGEKGFQKADDFDLDPTSKVKAEIASAWADARDQWRIFRRKADALKEGATGTTETRNLWMTPLLGLLGYQVEFAAKGEEVNGRNYAISHRDTSRDGFPVHIVGCNDSLDCRRTEGGTRMSPHALVQEYLNLTEHLFAVVTNGGFLRLLRDSTRLVKLSFLEFDLDRMFEEELFADFAILFRLVHVSRMPRTQESAAESIIENYHQDALDSGSRIRDGLSDAVERSIKSLANGFLKHPANDILRQSIISGETDHKTFYQWQLRLIYRLLFLMVIEERDLIFSRDADRRYREVYYDYYSIGRLRRLSVHRHFADRAYQDAWTGLRNTFQLFEDIGYGKKLGIAPLAGDLFDGRAIGLLNDCRLDNEILLTCLKNLSLFTNPITHQVMRVNYAALNVEEFGSVYEGLLEYDPTIQEMDGRLEFSFVGGDDRAASGSHYTPDELVQPLIKHSLDYIIAGKLKEPDPEKALLGINICDVACGSGHILLNAARRIATELAVLRTGEDQPSPPAFRAAVRDVIRNCIYGVDLNPLAVELCKVSLWLEAHVPGEPLNFLDHHIKCGNAIVGLANREELQRGIPDEAFKTLPDDDKRVAAAFRKQNKEERRGYQTLDFSGRPAGDLDALCGDFTSVANLPEQTTEEIRKKQEAYAEFRRGIHLRNLKTLADIQVAQFYIPKTEETRRKATTHDQYRRYLKGENPHPEPTAFAQAIAYRKRFFHWFLEFPEIMSQGGFDCILGNPPYLGGQALSGTYGYPFCEYVKWQYVPIGLSDLVVFFVRRIYKLLKPNGITAFITTNSIKDGDIRREGLEKILDDGGVIMMAVRAIKWPGRANLTISLVAISRGNVPHPRFLNGRQVDCISAYLEDEQRSPEPNRLHESFSKVLVGTHYLGDGFVIPAEQAQRMLMENADNSDVLFPLFNCQELNNLPDHLAKRYIINFHTWDEEKASQYADAFAIAKEHVWPERQKKAGRLRDRWWLFKRPYVEISNRSRTLDRFFACGITTKHMSFSAMSPNHVFSHAVCVLVSDRWDHFSVVQSSLHECWARKLSGAHELRLRYSPSNCFETFPFPEHLWQMENPELGLVGKEYHERRRSLMRLLWIGLTGIYNLFHTRDLTRDIVAAASKKDTEIAVSGYDGLLELRRKHVELDTAVLCAYGWHEPTDDGPPIDLRHDFHEVDYLPENDRIRYTIHPDARREILKRLLLLNHRRHAEEEAAAKKTKSEKGSRADKSDADDGKEPEKLPLFD